jgi:hypothetical protein
MRIRTGLALEWVQAKQPCKCRVRLGDSHKSLYITWGHADDSQRNTVEYYMFQFETEEQRIISKVVLMRYLNQDFGTEARS